MKSSHHTSTLPDTSTTNDQKNLPGIWLGIDLGTTNTTAAFYSPSKHVSKLIRFTPTYSSIQKHNNKFGKILPSAVYYKNGCLKSIGKSALMRKTTCDNSENDKDKCSGGILLTSVKRIWGMDQVQIKDEIQNDKTFLDSCPFKTTWVNNELQIIINEIDEQSSNYKNKGGKNSIVPIEVAEILLKTIREQANEYFLRERRKKKHYPLGLQQESEGQDKNAMDYKIRHCIITVPAHFSRKQREKIIQAANNAGFDGYIGTLVESTAAAMAYGLFVSPTKLVKHRSKDGSSVEGLTKLEGRKILVCDIGGGTTDITIAQIIDENGKDSQAAFQVLATAGNRRLGGDDMDEALARFVLNQNLKNKINLNCNNSNQETWNKLRMLCRNAKENLCGDGRDSSPQDKTTIDIEDKVSVVLTNEQFEHVIQPLVDKVALLVKKTLESCKCSYQSIDEVILVGGATRTPAIRRMLQESFNKNELCYSIDADAAVAQGAAIQCAIKSSLVPTHELRNALMLDALPHTIGVLVSTGDDDELYVPILEKGTALPAMNYASFHLADKGQKGVTIIAVEDVGEDQPLQRIGEFNFLLRRLSEETLVSLGNATRSIDVGMTVDIDGRFIVSIFDKNDPDDLKRKERYQAWKRLQKNDRNTGNLHLYALKEISTDKEKEFRQFDRQETMLIISSMLLFGLYVIVRLLFHQVENNDGTNIII